MEILYRNIVENFRWEQAVMWIIGGVLIYLAVKKDMEPTLLLPIGFGAILVNLPLSGAVDQLVNGVTERGALSVLFDAGIANELFPLILFIGIGAMIDFGPLLANPKLMIFGAAAQFGIFFTLCLASMFFDINDAASIAIIGAADGPTSIVVAQKLGSRYLGAIMVAAYSYMALVPIIQPPVIKLLTTKKERMIRMPYEQKEVSRLTKILFPIIVTVIAGLIAPASVSLVGFLMFGNLIRECGRLDSLSETAQKVLGKPRYDFPRHHHRLPDEGGAVPLQGDAAHTRSGACRVHFRYRGRRAVCEIIEPVPEEEDQSYDRRGGDFGFPHVRTDCA